MQLTGIHHLTAISAKPRENLAFYTGVLGMRLVKKTVNQDDVSAYHLFYADGEANPVRGCHRGVLVDIGHQHSGPRCGEGAGDRLAYAAARTGHQRGAAVEPEDVTVLGHQ